MKKLLAIISFTAFLCYGVQSSNLTERELEKQIVKSGIAVFLDLLEQVRNVTEKIIHDNQFKKSRIEIQKQLKNFEQTSKENNAEKAKHGSSFLTFMLSLKSHAMCVAIVREVTDNFISPYVNILDKAFKTETMVEIRRDLRSNFLQEAPDELLPFLSYLLGKMTVKSGLGTVLKGGVNMVIEAGKIDLIQLHEEIQEIVNQVAEKAAEISALERQKEKNDFLVSLRTGSEVIVFYWDKILEHTRSVSFHEKYVNSVRKWQELTQLKNSSETYHVLIDPNTRHEFLNWTDKIFGKFFDAMGHKYYEFGSEVLGSDRFNQSNWALMQIPTVYGLPVYEKLTESGFGISELNRLLHRINGALLIMERNVHSRQTLTEVIIRQSMLLLSFYVENAKEQGEQDEILLPFKIIKELILEVWDSLLHFFKNTYINDPKYQQTERDINHVRSIFINELIKSGEFTEEKLKEAETNILSGIREIVETVLENLKMSGRFDERIDESILVIKGMVHDINMKLYKISDDLVE